MPMKQTSTAHASRHADKFVVRLPDGMRTRIAEVARCAHRSMNSEIVARLEQTLSAEGHLPAGSDGAPANGALHLHEQQLLQRFRRLPQAQQSALIALLGASSND